MFGMINISDLIIEPFDEAYSTSESLEYNSSQKATIVLRDYDHIYTNPTSQFNLLSRFSLDESLINAQSSDVQKLIKLPQIGIFIIDTSVTFKNIRIEDDLKYIIRQNAIWFAPAKLETKTFTLINFDVK